MQKLFEIMLLSPVRTL